MQLCVTLLVPGILKWLHFWKIYSPLNYGVLTTEQMKSSGQTERNEVGLSIGSRGLTHIETACKYATLTRTDRTVDCPPLLRGGQSTPVWRKSSSSKRQDTTHHTTTKTVLKTNNISCTHTTAFVSNIVNRKVRHLAVIF